MLESEDDKGGLLAEFLECDREYVTPMRAVVKFPRRPEFGVEMPGFLVQRPGAIGDMYLMLTVAERIRAVHKLRLSGGPEVFWTDAKILLCDPIGTTGPYEVWGMGPVSGATRKR